MSLFYANKEEENLNPQQQPKSKTSLNQTKILTSKKMNRTLPLNTKNPIRSNLFSSQNRLRNSQDVAINAVITAAPAYL